MSKSLGGTLFGYRCLSQDYCLAESVACLKEFCDEIILLDAGSDDGTAELMKSFEDKKTKVILLSKEEWDSQHGAQKLNYFTNKAIDHLTTEYNFNLQADEILHEKCYNKVREVIEFGHEGYLVKRINLWGSPYTQLNVEHSRNPCSYEIIRLAKSYCKSVGDAESIDAQCVTDYVEDIVIWHYGFVRDKKIMKQKTIHIQRDVFGMTPDVKLDGSDVFEPYKWFDKDKDLIPIPSPHPKLMNEWIKTRP